ncbi:MAG: YdcF family protein [Clostridia bacterium]|nr:YdcF family protein [Clostridia bacterium]
MDFIFIIIGFIFCLLFMIFFLPILGYVLNIGNIMGMIFCAVMAALAFSHKAVGRFAQSGKGKVIVTISAVILIIGIIYVGFLTALIIGADLSAPTDNATVIVLGCQVRGEHPSLMLWQRINAAKDYLNEHPNAVCIVSGGKGDDEQISEAQCMFDHLTAMGISADRIIMEDRSTNTVENIAYSKEIIEREGLSTDTAIVTDIFHEYRASNIVRNAGLNCGSVPAKVSWYLMPTFYVRELIAITASFLIPERGLREN